MRKLVGTKGLTRAEWLEWRKKGIGGSDAAAIVGMNAFSSPYAVWAIKTGALSDLDTDSETMRQGRDLEAYVASRFEEVSGKKVRRLNAMLQSEEYEFMLADIDRDIVGESAGLECKTTSAMNTKRFKGGDFPENYYVQCCHYMAVTGYDRWYLAVLILGSAFKVFMLTRKSDDKKPDFCENMVYVEQTEIDALVDAEESFWNSYVVPNIPPTPDGSKATGDALDRLYPFSVEGVEDLSEFDNDVKNYI